VAAGYDAPFPDDSSKAGARVFPGLVPTTSEDPASAANRAARETLARFDKPFLEAFPDNDPITGGGDRVFHELVPGAQGLDHVILAGGGHFLQEDVGSARARLHHRAAAARNPPGLPRGSDQPNRLASSVRDLTVCVGGAK